MSLTFYQMHGGTLGDDENEINQQLAPEADDDCLVNYGPETWEEFRARNNFNALVNGVIKSEPQEKEEAPEIKEEDKEVIDLTKDD
jgi:hypothetical protein